MKKAMTLLATGIATGVTFDRVALELRKPAPDRFPRLRREVNERVNPWLLEHNIPGGPKAEIGILEHVGRTSGTTYHTPVHPTIRGETVFIPAPLGAGSQWARNLLRRGRARVQLHERVYDLDQPELIRVAETGFFPVLVAAPFDRLGFRYVRLHSLGSAPGAFAEHVAPVAPSLTAEPSLVEPFEIPIEPKMVERETVPV